MCTEISSYLPYQGKQDGGCLEYKRNVRYFVREMCEERIQILSLIMDIYQAVAGYFAFSLL